MSPCVDLYDCAYQVVYNGLKKKKIAFNESDLRRRTIEEIRRRLRFRIALEDIDSADFYKWPAEKKLNWLQDLQEFVSKTLGKRRYIQLRDRRDNFKWTR